MPGFRETIRIAFEPWSLPWVKALTGVGFIIAFLAGFTMIFKESRKIPRLTQSLSQMKQIAVGLNAYAADYNEILPPASTWEDGLPPYLKGRKDDLFDNPHSSTREPVSYGFNAALAGRPLGAIPPTTPMIIETFAPGPNALADPGRPHLAAGRFLVAFPNEKVQAMTQAEFSNLRWTQ